MSICPSCKKVKSIKTVKGNFVCSNCNETLVFNMKGFSSIVIPGCFLSIIFFVGLPVIKQNTCNNTIINLFLIANLILFILLSIKWYKFLKTDSYVLIANRNDDFKTRMKISVPALMLVAAVLLGQKFAEPKNCYERSTNNLKGVSVTLDKPLTLEEIERRLEEDDHHGKK